MSRHPYGLGRIASARLEARLAYLRQSCETDNSNIHQSPPVTEIPRKTQRNTTSLFERAMNFFQGAFTSPQEGTAFTHVQHWFSKIPDQDDTWEIINVVDDHGWEIIPLVQDFDVRVARLLEQAADEVTANLTIPRPPNYQV